MTESSRPPVVVLLGGPSAEHDVSVVSGTAIAAALVAQGSGWRGVRGAVHAELASFAAGAADPRLMVKPARLGSSVGMTLVHDPSEIDAALETAFRHDTLVLAETYLAGARDLEVSVIGNDPAAIKLYGPGEIISGHEFYDYAAKYTPGLSETSTRARLGDPQRATILKIA